MTEWRNAFSTIYKLVKNYCNISDDIIAGCVGVSVESVRQYTSQRKTIPDNIDSLCVLFEEEIDKLYSIEKKKLLLDIQKGINCTYEEVKSESISKYICAMLKQCNSNNKSHLPYTFEYANQHKATGHIKAVVFDFDGTLTTTKLRTTWESLWELLGYNVQECRNLHRQFDKGEFNHQEWCDLTAKKFINKGLTRQQLIDFSKQIKLIPGCKKTLQQLKDYNIKLYIVSGSIKEIIENVLGSSYNYFSEIQANEFVFDTQTSILNKILGTEYDFHGKANYISYVANRLGISASDILFVGNSNNDTWAYLSGAHTLCINPTHTNYHNDDIWHNTIVECKNLSEILQFIT